MFKAARFCMEDENTVFTGFTDGSTSNDYQMPFFAKEDADKILQLFLDAECIASYDSKLDKYIFSVDAEGNTIQVKGEDIIVDCEDIHVYGIGRGQWPWKLYDTTDSCTRCFTCGEVLKANNEIYAYHGMLFCTMDCIYTAAEADTLEQRKVINQSTESLMGSDINL